LNHANRAMFTFRQQEVQTNVASHAYVIFRHLLSSLWCYKINNGPAMWSVFLH